ncbi:MAG: prolyl oligopeptidase family serine peptidase [Egibacteraceae bacterium]
MAGLDSVSLAYPPARIADVVDDFHGKKIADPYRWLEDTGAPEVAEWIAAQNALTESWLAEVPAREAIRGRLTELWNHPRAGAPWRRGRRWFQLRNTGLEDQDVLWTMAVPDEEGRVLMDPNTLSADGTISLAAAVPSADGSLLAYATSTAGSDWMTWRVRDVETGEEHNDVLQWSKFSRAAWTHDNLGFFYSVYDPPPEGVAGNQRNLGQRLHYHRLGDAQDADRIVIAWPDEPEWGFGATVTTDGRWLLINVWRGTEPRSRLWIADLAPVEAPRPLVDEFDASYRFIGSDGDVLYLLTDLDAPLFRIMAVDVYQPKRVHWREVVPQATERLEGARLVGGQLVTLYLREASHRIRLFALDGTEGPQVPLDGRVSVGALTGREDDRQFFFTSVGFTRSSRVERHDLDSRETVTIREPGVAIHGHTADQVLVASKDGTRVPMFLVHRDGLEPGSDLPTLLYGYGGFDISVAPSCLRSWLVWLELGGLLAVANLRGGGEYGKAWHDAGRLANKQNCFDDFIACAEWLVSAGWTRTGRLAISGKSNGGLLVGACMTQRPDLFGACVPEVGVLDMLRFHLFTIGWAWTSDYGDPGDPAQFETLLAYSPLHNTRPGIAYPPTLVVTGDHDDRVVPGHSLKFAAALQAAQGGDSPVLMRVETSAGHGHGTSTSKLIAQRADVLAFLCRALDVPFRS